MISRILKSALQQKKTLIGTFIKLANATVVEALGLAGLDFGIIDIEHAPCDQIVLENIIRSADGVGLPTIVRVSDSLESSIVKALDLGASGIQIPNLTSIEQVTEAISLTKYYPLGKRGLSFSQRSASYGMQNSKEYLDDVNKNVINVVHIENQSMISITDKLCAINDVDVLFIGPMDISQALGYPGNPSHPIVQEKIAEIIQICNENDKTTGIFVSSSAAAVKYIEMGVSYIALGSDLSFLLDGYRNIIGQLKLLTNTQDKN